MTKRILSTIIIITLITTVIPLFTPKSFAQAGDASVTFKITGCYDSCILSLAVTSPVDVAEFQVSMKTSSTINLALAQTTVTGFMSGATQLGLKGSEIDEYRWFNLQSPRGKTATLSIPISNIRSEVAVYLEGVDLLDANGNNIKVAGLPQGAILIVTSTTTLTTTTTATITSTTTTTQTTTATTTSTSTVSTTSTTITTATTTITSRVTTTTTSTSSATSTQTVTQTATSTSTTTSTATSTQLTTQTSVSTLTSTSTTLTTITTAIGVWDPTTLAISAALILIVGALLAVVIRRRRKV